MPKAKFRTVRGQVVSFKIWAKNILANVVKFYCVNYMKLVLWLQNVIVCISTVGQQNTKKSTLAGHETNEAKLMF